MARTVRVIAGIGLLAASAARAAGPCEEDRATLGLALANRAGALVVEAADAGSPAAAGGLASGDEVAQVNATVPRACADFAKAVREARRDHKALLFLVRRGGAEVPLVVGAAVWRPVAAADAGVPGETTGRPALAPAVPVPPPLPPDVPVSVADVLADMGVLAPVERPRENRRAYDDALRDVRRKIETLAARRAAPHETTLSLRAVLRYFEAAAIAWRSIESQREREHRPRHYPVTEDMRAEYFEDSAPAAVIEEFAFLAETVVREPSVGLTEANGLWRPARARSLLWERGREALSTLRAGAR